MTRTDALAPATLLDVEPPSTRIRAGGGGANALSVRVMVDALLALLTVDAWGPLPFSDHLSVLRAPRILAARCSSIIARARK